MFTLQFFIGLIVGCTFTIFAIVLYYLWLQAREAKRFNKIVDDAIARDKNQRDFTKGNTDSNN